MIDETDILIDDRITQAALTGDGYLITKLEDQKRKALAQEFASKCKTTQERLNKIKAERDNVLRERDAFNDQLVLAATELRKAEDLAYERNLEYTELKLKLALLDDRLLILRDQANERKQALRELLASRNGGNQ